jgi:HK97 family phage prohead protease
MTHALETRADPKKPYGDVSYADPGYQADKKKRYPLDSEEHCKAAWSYINMPKNAAKYSPAQVASIKGRIKSAAKKYGIAINEKSRADIGVCVRSFSFAFEDRAGDNDGRTLEGYAAVYDTPTKIRDLQGDFEETILKGAFTRSLKERTPVLQFEHGRDPRVGAVPIGQIHELRDDERGLYVRARLYDNAVVEPVRQAIEGRSITGMSFRFDVPEGGDEWPTRDKRTIGDLNAYELGPVVFPAYDTTSVTVRSLLAQLDPQEHRALIRELAAEIRLAVDLEDLDNEVLDFTWRPDTRSVGGGDLDAEVEDNTASQQRSEFSDRIDGLHVKLLALRRHSAYEEEHPSG